MGRLKVEVFGRKGRLNSLIREDLTKIGKILEIDNRKLDVYLVDSEESRQINKKLRGKDYSASILSFEGREGKREFFYPPGEDLLGELFICPEVIKEEARKRGFTYKEWRRRLLVHGLLHLLGYTHEKDDDAKLMESEEKKLLRKLGWKY